MQTITEHLKRFRQAKRGISNVIVVMLSLILIVLIVSNVVLWSYQMNQFDLERMQESIKIANVTRSTPSSWFTTKTEYIMEKGNIISGTYRDTWVADNVYETFREEASGTSTQSFYPSGYNLWGSTSLVSGSLSDLQSDNNVYMTFRSYVSASSATAKTNAFIAYRDSTASLNIPKERTWTGDTATWGSQSNMPTADSPVRFVRVACSPIEQRSFEKIVVTLSDDGYLDTYVWNGTAWIVTNNIAFTGTIANAYRCFDIAYEKTSGRALLVYSRGTTTNEIGYKIWTFGIGWSDEYLLDLPYTTGIVYWISLAQCPATRPGTADDNEIAMIYLDANRNVHGYVWTGSTWSLMGATAAWDVTAAIATEECIAVAYEQTSGRAMFIWGDAITDYNYYRIWDGTTLTDPTLLTIAAQGAATNWVTLKSNPISNELVYLVVDGALDLNTAYWSGSAWTIHTEHDSSVDTHAQRCADFAWEPTGSKGLLVWGTTAGQITYKTFTAPNTWGTATYVPMGAYVHPWVQLRTNPRNVTGDVKILGAILEGTVFDLGAISWDGATFTVIGSSTISADTTVITYECFEMEFMNFGPPTEFTCEVEFTGTSNTESWTQLIWTVDGSFTTTSVTTTFQLYNYQMGQYPTSGDGYMTDTIGTTDVTNTQTITTNPTYFRDASGNWKLKIKGVKATNAPFDFKVDFVEFKAEMQSAYALSIIGEFTLDVSTYPLEYIDSIETQIRFRANDIFEDWLLYAYNWTSGQYNIIGQFTPTTDFEYYTVNLTNSWQSYVNSDGTIRIKFCDANLDASQTIIDIDFLGVRAVINSACFNFKNNGSTTVHIVSIWIINSTSHKRYNANFFINIGEEAIYIRADISLPEEFIAKVVTERGNIAVFTQS